MSVKPAAKELSLVLVGDFNPAILHPQWFAAQGLIKSAEATDSSIEVVHKEVALWSLDWLKVHVTTSRLQLQSEKEAFFLPLRDLLLGMFSLLSHTPASALGINWGSYYQFPDNDSYQKFGHAVLPKDRWNKALKNPATLSLTVRSERDDGFDGRINTTVTGHNRFPFCIYVTINDHFDLDKSASGSVATEQIATRIGSAWQSSQSLSDRVAHELFEGF